MDPTLNPSCFLDNVLLPLQQVEKELAGINARLNNPNFVAKASAPVIDEARQQAADASAKLAELEAKLQQVAALGR